MSHTFKTAFGLTALLLSAPTLAQITLYEGEGFRGRAFTTERSLADFTRSGFNDRVSSVIVDGGRWEACEDTGFRGHCVVLRQGSYDSLQRLGIDNRLSSIQRSVTTGVARQHVRSRSPSRTTNTAAGRVSGSTRLT